MSKKVRKDFRQLLEDNGCTCVVRFAATITTANKYFIDIFIDHLKDKMIHSRGCGYRENMTGSSR